MRESVKAGQNTGAIALVFMSSFIDMLGFSLVIPILPFLLSDEFGLPGSTATTWYGILLSSYAITEMFGTTLMGPLSDRFGRRPILLISLFGSTLGFIGQALSPNQYWLLGTRIFAGLFGSSNPVCEAYITDCTIPIERPRYMSLLGACGGIAYMFGPALGSGLGEFGLRIPYYVSAGVAAVAFLITLFLLPESRKRKTSLSLDPENPETVDLKEEKNRDEKRDENR